MESLGLKLPTDYGISNFNSNFNHLESVLALLKLSIVPPIRMIFLEQIIRWSMSLKRIWNLLINTPWDFLPVSMYVLSKMDT